MKALMVITCLLVAGCDKPSDALPSQHDAAVIVPVASAPVEVVEAAPPPVEKVELEIESVGNTMTFSKTALTAPAGSEVHLVFKNNSTMDVLPHNWVLVHAGTEAKVAADGLALGPERNYLPETDDVIAATVLARPGKTSEVTFTAPKYTGKYPYICTVPGHYIMMKGVFTVTPAKE